ncbi:response regulator [Ferrovibrio xuzhouensis]|uniref:Response regulator n=1 Tax=Ferrovibrio xuzhouensis TaxID=1576914 RepID=A0ABV7VIJ2_9PROT
MIDDHQDSGELVRRVAEKAGFAVAVTDRADRFRALCIDFAPHLICLDIVMPQEDGIELIRWLASIGSDAAIYIISGHSPAYARAAIEVGRSQGLNMAGALQKPVSLATLRETFAAARPGRLSAAAD